MVTCPGCALALRADATATYDGYYNTCAECWRVYTSVLGREFGDATLFGRVHQLTVDAYAVQHAGGPHPDKSIAIHLCGLHLVLERGNEPTDVPRLLQRVARATKTWPHYPRPPAPGRLTIKDVADADDHAAAARAWAESVWSSWSMHQDAVAAFLSRALG